MRPDESQYPQDWKSIASKDFGVISEEISESLLEARQRKM